MEDVRDHVKAARNACYPCPRRTLAFDLEGRIAFLAQLLIPSEQSAVPETMKDTAAAQSEPAEGDHDGNQLA